MSYLIGNSNHREVGLKRTRLNFCNELSKYQTCYGYIARRVGINILSLGFVGALREFLLTF